MPRTPAPGRPQGVIISKPTYLYRAFDADGALLYVGITYDLHGRIKQHQAGKEQWDRDVARVVAEPFPARDEARLAESTAIRTESPKWNIMGISPQGRVKEKRANRKPEMSPAGDTPGQPEREVLRWPEDFLPCEDLRLLGADEGENTYWADEDGMIWWLPWIPGHRLPDWVNMLPATSGLTAAG